MSPRDPIVIVGAGHAGVQAAASLREAGVDTPIKLIGAERYLPYERPPLSKRYLQGTAAVCDILLRAPTFYEAQNIDLILGDAAVGLARGMRRVELRSGASITYSQLVFATGSSLKRPPEVWPTEAYASLQSLDDAEQLRAMLKRGGDVVVIGAGFIGLEFAAVAAEFGCSVNVVELSTRPLGRSASRIVSSYVTTEYIKRGIQLYLGVGITSIKVDSASTRKVILLSDQHVLHADVIVVGIGVRANDTLAAASGIDCPDGIRVAGDLRTQDENISAIGDCAYYPNLFMDRMARVESVQNASDHARTLAKRIAGETTVYNTVPWFWSDLGKIRLQIAGVLAGADQFVTRGSLDSGAFSVFGFANGKLTGVESINRPADHLLSRRLLAEPALPTIEEISNQDLPLKALLNKSNAATMAR